MAKGQTTVSDFAVAPRRSRPLEQAATLAGSASNPAEASTETKNADQGQEPAPPGTEAEQPANRLIAPTQEARRERTTTRALQREDSRVRLRDLKRARDRESKHYVNCPLDYDTKVRLQKAAIENDVRMTVIMKAAIDQFLKDKRLLIDVRPRLPSWRSRRLRPRRVYCSPSWPLEGRGGKLFRRQSASSEYCESPT